MGEIFDCGFSILNYLRGRGGRRFVLDGAFLGGLRDMKEMRGFCCFGGDLGFLQGVGGHFAPTPNCVDMRRTSSEVGFKNYAVRCPSGAVCVFCGEFEGFAKKECFLARWVRE
jgi:hypothetical protein